MKNNHVVAIILAIALVYSLNHSNHQKTPEQPDQNQGLLARLFHRLDDVDVQLIKIESLVTLVKTEQEAKSALLAAAIEHQSTPLRAEDLSLLSPSYVTSSPAILSPLVQTSLGAVTQPQPAAVTPGMEPAKEPVPTRPVYAQPVKAAGHWESYGFRGRRRAWVSDQQPVAQAYQQHQVSFQRSGVPVLRRFGSCRGGGCGN